jgi:hypothetical protein
MNFLAGRHVFCDRRRPRCPVRGWGLNPFAQSTPRPRAQVFVDNNGKKRKKKKEPTPRLPPLFARDVGMLSFGEREAGSCRGFFLWVIIRRSTIWSKNANKDLRHWERFSQDSYLCRTAVKIRGRLLLGAGKRFNVQGMNGVFIVWCLACEVFGTEERVS